MDDIEIIEDVKPIKKGNKKIILILVIIAILLLGGFCVYYLVTKDNKKVEQTPVVEETKEDITEETKKELLRIIDLEETGHGLLTETELKNLGLEDTNFINITNNELYSTFMNFDVGKDIIINELSDYYKKEIVFKYAYTNELTSVDNCNFYLDKDTYDKVIKLYGIDSIKFEESEIIEDKYNFNLSCNKNINVSKVEDELTFERVNKSIVINYKANLNDEVKKTIIFTFNQREDESFYLYKVNVKND